MMSSIVLKVVNGQCVIVIIIDHDTNNEMDSFDSQYQQDLKT